MTNIADFRTRSSASKEMCKPNARASALLSVRVPPQFNPQIMENQLVLPCSIVWRRGFWIGVQFEWPTCR
jgi:hypothetical protein